MGGNGFEWVNMGSRSFGRGGSWDASGDVCIVSCFGGDYPGCIQPNIGFRIAKTE